jgi:hypothetical protein
VLYCFTILELDEIDFTRRDTPVCNLINSYHIISIIYPQARTELGSPVHLPEHVADQHG